VAVGVVADAGLAKLFRGVGGDRLMGLAGGQHEGAGSGEGANVAERHRGPCISSPPRSIHVVVQSRSAPRPVKASIEEWTLNTRPASQSQSGSGSRPPSIRLSATVQGSISRARPDFIAAQARSTTYSGARIGVSSGARAPANMPVLM